MPSHVIRADKKGKGWSLGWASLVWDRIAQNTPLAQSRLGQRPKAQAAALFWCQGAYLVLSQFYDIKSVALIQGGPSGYFIHISITKPIASALKNCYI